MKRCRRATADSEVADSVILETVKASFTPPPNSTQQMKTCRRGTADSEVADSVILETVKASVTPLPNSTQQMKRCPRETPDSDADSKSDLASKLKPDSVILETLKTLEASAATSTSKPLTLSDVGLSTVPYSSIMVIVFGHLVLSIDGHTIDCAYGRRIPQDIGGIESMQSDGLFILLVEKEANYFRLNEDKFCHRFTCVIVNAEKPDVSAQLFLRKLKMELNLPVLALVDSDPSGFKLLKFFSTYGCDLTNFTALDIKWLGIRPSDLDKHEIPQWCRLPLTKRDRKTVKDLLENDFVNKNPEWVEELNLMLKTKKKVEAEVLSSLGIRYLTETYLPLKLQEQDWL